DCHGKTRPWEQHHTFYIDHGNGWSTWYLYADDLAPDVKGEIAQDGYAVVVKGETVAYAGSFGLHCLGCTTLHFDVRKAPAAGSAADGVIVVPYDPASFVWADADADGVADSCDSCLLVANGTQADSDGDGIGDACDPCPLDAGNDADGDGSCGNADDCPSIYNPEQKD